MQNQREIPTRRLLGAEDGIRTRDPHLGKVTEENLGRRIAPRNEQRETPSHRRPTRCQGDNLSILQFPDLAT